MTHVDARTTRTGAVPQSRRALLVREIGGFGIVGAVSFVADIALYNAIAPHGWLKAKLVSTVVATVIAYVGNRSVSFSHRTHPGIVREIAWFFAINAATLAASEVLLGIVAYPLDQRTSVIVMNVANLMTIGLGTVVRFVAYKRFVFPPATRQHAPHGDRRGGIVTDRHPAPPRTLVIMPTFNEIENLESMIDRIRSAVPDADILLADDNSPDGTGREADEIASTDRHVHVLHRPGKAGLGAAYVAGFD